MLAQYPYTFSEQAQSMTSTALSQFLQNIDQSIPEGQELIKLELHWDKGQLLLRVLAKVRE